MEGLIEGRIIHYVLPDGRNEGAHRPAIIVMVWDKEDGLVNLQVFTDGTNDYPAHLSQGVMWATSVRYDENKAPGTWHWIERA